MTKYLVLGKTGDGTWADVGHFEARSPESAIEAGAGNTGGGDYRAVAVNNLTSATVATESVTETKVTVTSDRTPRKRKQTEEPVAA